MTDIKLNAVRWLGEQNCEEAFALLGLEHYDDETDHTVIYLPDDGSKIEPGDWIVRDENGDCKGYTDAEYRAKFGTASRA